MERPEDTFEAVKPFISNRLKAIEKLSKDEIEPKIETKDQAQEYFWTRYETFKRNILVVNLSSIIECQGFNDRDAFFFLDILM